MKQHKSLSSFVALLLMPLLLFNCSDEQMPVGAQFSLVRQHLVLTTTSVSFGYNSRLTTILTVEGENTAWVLTGLPDWLSASATSGRGATTITLTAKANTSPDESRAALLTFASTASDYQYAKTISVSQPAAEVYITPSESAMNFVAAGESKMLAVSSNVEWTVEASESWVITSKSGDKQFRITVEENLGTTRNATIYLKRKGTTTIASTISLTQAEAGVTGSADVIPFEVDGESHTTTIQTEASWTVNSPDSWIAVSPTSGNAGSATLTITSQGNTSASGRSSYVYVRIGSTTKLSIPVQQEGIKYNVSVASLVLKSTTEEEDFDFESNARWSVLEKPDWLELKPAQGTKGTTTLMVTPKDNPGTEARTGTIIIGRDGFSGNKAIAVKQAGKAFGDLCQQMDFPNTAATQTLTVETDGQWSASTAETWIHLSPSSGRGNATLQVSVDASPEKEERTGTISVSVGTTVQSVKVIQEGRYINISYDNLLTNSKPATIQLFVASNMEWTASSDADWLTVTPPSGSGDAMLILSVVDNPSVNARTGNISITTDDETKLLSFTQPGRTLSVSATEIFFDYEGGTSETVTVTTDGTYTVTSSESWATISQNGKTFTITASTNNTDNERTATITVTLTGLNNGESLSRTIKVLQRSYPVRDFTVTGNGKTVTFKMIKVEPGTFQMGRAGSEDVATPVHSVTLTNSYFMGETEVTQGLWYAVMGQSPTSDGSKWDSTRKVGDNYPAYYINYEDCQQFLTKLNQLTGQTFRFRGNVWEWCADWHASYSSGAQTDPTGPTTGFYRVNRGGSWVNTAANCRVANRFSNSPSGRYSYLGLRLAL